jgi:hypothetical protein
MTLQEKLDRSYTQTAAAEIALRLLLAKTRAAAQAQAAELAKESE